MGKTTSPSARQISELLRDYDEASGNSFLDTIAETYPASSSLINHLLSMAEAAEPTLQLACLALLRRYQKGGILFSARATERMLELLPTLPDWQARLQILQMLPALEIPATVADSLADSLHLMLGERNKFIRAWAYGGLHRIAFLHKEYRAEVMKLLREASLHEAASVCARLRQLSPL